MKYSIIIPTYNHCDDFLKPCIKSILKNTDLDLIQIIVSANGCTDNTREYLDELSVQLGDCLTVVWSDAPTGFARANNDAIPLAKCEYILLLNNDCVVLDFCAKNEWLTLLENAFDEDTGLVGVHTLYNKEIKDTFLIFYCVMIKKEVFNKIGLLDEDFGIGSSEDIEFCHRARLAGYKLKEVMESTYSVPEKLYVNTYPLWHKAEGTVHDKTLVPNWDDIYNNNLKLLNQKVNSNIVKYSIIIPTYSHLEDLLIPCVESILAYTDMSNIELIISANGCDYDTKDYLFDLGKRLGNNLKVVWSDDPNGYTKATNRGLEVATGDYIIFLNNDTVLLEQPKNTWINFLTMPFLRDPKVGITGPLVMHDDYADVSVAIFFCACISRELYTKLGLLDEIFSPGAGEDVDYCAKAQKLGYKIVPVPRPHEFNGDNNVNEFPIWHKDNQTFKDVDGYATEIMKRNGLINTIRHNKNIKLNLGAGGIELSGYLSVDQHDPRAHIMADATQLMFEENTVSEIVASHLFEHINPYHALDTLKHWLSILKPNGKLIMEMPDFERTCHEFIKADKATRYGLLNTVYGTVNTSGSGDPSDITSYHKWGWYPEIICDHLSAAGYVDIKILPEQFPHPWYNFRVEAIKPQVGSSLDWLIAQDKSTYEEAIENDEYGVFDEVKDAVVIDVGANIGLFSIFAAANGAKGVYAIEAQKDNFTRLKQNIHTSGYSSIIFPYYYAIHDTTGEIVYINNDTVKSHISGQDEGDPVETITIDTLLWQIFGDIPTPENLILKMDVEGAEFPAILETDNEVLGLFSIITLEIHGDENNDPEVLRSKFLSAGFMRTEYRYGFYTRHPDGTVTENDMITVEKWVNTK